MQARVGFLQLCHVVELITNDHEVIPYVVGEDSLGAAAGWPRRH